MTYEEKQKYLDFRRNDYISDVLADKIDARFGRSNSHEGWKTYNFFLVLQVLDLVPDEDLYDK